MILHYTQTPKLINADFDVPLTLLFFRKICSNDIVYCIFRSKFVQYREPPVKREFYHDPECSIRAILSASCLSDQVCPSLMKLFWQVVHFYSYWVQNKTNSGY